MKKYKIIVLFSLILASFAREEYIFPDIEGNTGFKFETLYNDLTPSSLEDSTLFWNSESSSFVARDDIKLYDLGIFNR